jgi:hypothetical protein
MTALWPYDINIRTFCHVPSENKVLEKFRAAVIVYVYLDLAFKIKLIKPLVSYSLKTSLFSKHEFQYELVR